MVTCKDHAFLKTLLESTVLTTIALGFVNLTISIRYAGIYSFVLNSSFEETFTSFTCDDPIMKTSGSVLTYHTG